MQFSSKKHLLEAAPAFDKAGGLDIDLNMAQTYCPVTPFSLSYIKIERSPKKTES